MRFGIRPNVIPNMTSYIGILIAEQKGICVKAPDFNILTDEIKECFDGKKLVTSQNTYHFISDENMVHPKSNHFF